jgi:Protein of unknown function (DUF3037)
MNRQVCKYSIICFQPFVETGEFANIGIVLYVPNSKQLFFKLLSARECGRITEFFKPIKREVYSESIQIIRAELERIQELVNQPSKVSVNLYDELIRPREGIIRFSQNRVLFSIDLPKTVDDLFEHYIQHSFAHKEEHEEEMRKRVRNLLNEQNMIETFKDGMLGDENKYSVRLPFVNNHKQAAIKPIHFTHTDSNKLIEHGITWLGKIQQLKRYSLIRPDNVLFVYRPPKTDQGILFEAFNDVRNQIEDAGVLMTPIDQPKKITDFAKQLTS